MTKVARIDRAVFVTFLAALVFGVFLFGRANIMADSVDYYVNLQRLSPAGGEAIVRNAHFAAQRSPGYSICALLPHLALVYLVAPAVTTTCVEPPTGEPLGPPGLIPPQPLLLREVPFHDFRVPSEDRRFEWKVALALAVTSYGFLFAGLLALARALRRMCPFLPGYSLIVVLALGCPLLVENIFATPLYATLTAFGASALFCLRFLKADGLVAGAWLGLVVLTRLETVVFAAALVALLLAHREQALCLRLIVGASWAALAWAGYNYRVFGTLFSFEILRGDINLLQFDPGYILRCLVHPACGLLFWSAPVCLGLAGLVPSKSTPLRCLGMAALPLVAVWLVRVPVMIVHPDAALEIGGIPVMPPPGEGGMLGLIRADINRYAAVLAPMAVLGLRDLIERWRAAYLTRTIASAQSGRL